MLLVKYLLIWLPDGTLTASAGGTWGVGRRLSIIVICKFIDYGLHLLFRSRFPVSFCAGYFEIRNLSTPAPLSVGCLPAPLFRARRRCSPSHLWRKWSSDGSVKQFGVAEPLKDLSGKGSPRWKQRAFYDFVKDLSPFLIEVKVVRVAVWDRLVAAESTKTLRKMHAALIRQSGSTAFREASSTALAALVKERAAD